MKKQVGPDGKEYVLLEADELEKLQQQIQQLQQTQPKQPQQLQPLIEADELEKLQQQIQQSQPSQPQIIIVNQASANADVEQENQAKEDGCLEQLGGLLFLGLIIYACFAFGWC